MNPTKNVTIAGKATTCANQTPDPNSSVAEATNGSTTFFSRA